MSPRKCVKTKVDAQRGMSSRMGILGTHPAVFVRVANKGVAGYGTWKRVRKTGDRGSKGRIGSKGDKGSGAENAESAGLTELAGVVLLIHSEWSHEKLTLSRNNLEVLRLRQGKDRVKNST